MIRAALLAEGASDRALLPILDWVVREATAQTVTIDWVDRSGLLLNSNKLADKVRAARELVPCDLLFVHRDADKQSPEMRYTEIDEAVPPSQRYVAVVPVRMTEAWLLFDEQPIRVAAGRPTGKEPLRLPPLASLEGLPDSKATLEQVLRTAHGGTGRRAAKFHTPTAIQQLAARVEDWRPLRSLSAFQRLEGDTRAALLALGVSLHNGAATYELGAGHDH